MSEDLGARLMRAGLATRAQLLAALSDGPVTGGRLAAQLIDEGVPEDDVVGLLLGEGHGPVLELRELLQASSAVADRMPLEMRRAFLALPVRPEAAGLLVAMADPSDAHALGEIRHAVRSPVIARVARVSDIASVLGARARGPRATPLALTRRKRKITEQLDDDDLVPIEEAGPLEEAPQGDERPEANDGEVVLPLVKQKPLSRAPAAAAPVKTFRRPSGLPPADDAPPDAAPSAAESAPPAPLAPAPSDPPAPFPAAEDPPPIDSVPPPAIAKGNEEAERTTATYGRPETRPLSKPPPKSIIPPKEGSWADLDAIPPRPRDEKKRRVRQETNERRPPELGAILAAMRAARDRDRVVTLACEGALTVARAAVFLALRKNVLRGWAGLGPGVASDAIRNLWLPATSPSMFKAVVQTGTPHEGAYGSSAADHLYRAATGSRGGRISIQPVLVGGRVVAVLAADDVTFGPIGYERIGVLAHAAGQAFKRLIVESKK